MVASVYCWTGEGWSDRNEALIKHVAEKLEALKIPWVMALDGNMEPQQFSQGWWASTLPGVVVAPTDPLGTCDTDGARRTIDYFVVHKSLEEFVVSIKVWQDYPSKPHKPVVLELQVGDKVYYKREQCAGAGCHWVRAGPCGGAGAAAGLGVGGASEGGVAVNHHGGGGRSAGGA